MIRNYFLMFVLLQLSGNITANPLRYLPPNIPAIIRGQSSLLSKFGKIVDGAGYSLHNTAFSLDLAMQANQPVGSESLGSVTLEPYQNGRDQKWGTSFYDPKEVTLSNGMVGKNVVSVYYPTESSRDKARIYSFETLSSPNLYRILNKESNQCLVANQSDSGSIEVQFGSCAEGNFTWLLRRTG